MNTEKEQTNSLVPQEKGELLSKQSIVSRSVVKNLIREAMEARKKAYAPYSNFKVGAALLSTDQEIITGCNIENAAYGISNCAERTALCKAVSEGKREFAAIAIVGGRMNELTDYCPPCGSCRQALREFVNPQRFLVIPAKSEDEYMLYFLEELLPMGFGPEVM